MADQLGVGDEAPNFDLSSTEDVLLMLCDEVPRNMVALYFFADPASDQSRADLAALGRARHDLASRRVNILGIAPAKMPELKSLQVDLSLPFPLLHDDRAFSAAYGVEAPDEDSSAAPALVLVGRDQKILWMANPMSSIDTAIADLTKVADADGSPTGNYPKKVINRIVDRWVN